MTKKRPRRPFYQKNHKIILSNSRDLLHAVIDGHTKFSAAEVIQSYHLNSSANVKRLKEALCKKEIISFDDNDTAYILDPLFEYWLRKNYFHA